MSPMSFLQKPARWMQLLATNSRSWSAAPNFAFELAVRRTSDDDMAGLDLGTCWASSTEVNEFTPRRSGASLSGSPGSICRDTTVRPSYGLAEATLYVMSAPSGAPAGNRSRFDYEKLSAGHAKRCGPADGGTELVSYGAPRSSTVRIVDPETRIENPGGQGRGDLGARRQRRERLLAQPATDRSARSVPRWSIPRRARRRDRGCAPETWA